MSVRQILSLLLSSCSDVSVCRPDPWMLCITGRVRFALRARAPARTLSLALHVHRTLPLCIINLTLFTPDPLPWSLPVSTLQAAPKTLSYSPGLGRP
jgi:hypothetical protein